MYINQQIQHFNSSQIKAAQPPTEGGLFRVSLVELSLTIFWSFVNNINEDHFKKRSIPLIQRKCAIADDVDENN